MPQRLCSIERSQALKTPFSDSLQNFQSIRRENLLQKPSFLALSSKRENGRSIFIIFTHVSIMRRFHYPKTITYGPRMVLNALLVAVVLLCTAGAATALVNEDRESLVLQPANTHAALRADITASYNVALQAARGFNFKPEAKTSVGFVTALTVDGKAARSDLVVRDPTSPSAGTLSVVAVLSHVTWDHNANPMYLSGFVSNANRAEMTFLEKTLKPGVDVDFNIRIFNYNAATKAYAESFAAEGGKTLQGTLDGVGSDPNYTVGDSPSTEVLSPQNFPFNIGIVPKVAANIACLKPDGSKSSFRWGK